MPVIEMLEKAKTDFNAAGDNLSPENQALLLDYEKLCALENPSDEDNKKKSECELAIANYYYFDLQQVQSAVDWFALAAYSENEAGYKANMALGSIFALQSDLFIGLDYFRQAEEIGQKLAILNESDLVFFNACAMWYGPDSNKNITALDYLNYAKKIELLVQANTEEAYAMLVGIAEDKNFIIPQLIVCQLGKDILPSETQAVLTQKENQAYLEALSFLYGWNGKHSNLLRAASLLKKIIDSPQEKNIEILYILQTLIAFSYLQQEVDREIYIPEAFHLLDQAHACLETIETPHRRAIILTLLSLNSYAEDGIQDYIHALLNFYSREVLRADLSNVALLSEHMLTLIDTIKPYIHSFAEVLYNSYLNQTDSKIRESILELAAQFKEKLIDDPESHSLLDQLIAECDVLAIPEEVTHEEYRESTPDSTEAVEEEHTELVSDNNDLMSQAEAELKSGNVDAALEHYLEIYHNTGSMQALSHAANIQSDQADEYASAIENFKLICHSEEAKEDFSLSYHALLGLKKIYDDLPERHPRRLVISDTMNKLLQIILTYFMDEINSSERVKELEEYLQVTNINPELIAQLHEIIEVQQEKIQEESRSLSVNKLIESTKNSSKRHLAALVSLLSSEKNNAATFPIVKVAVNRWLESTVKIDKDRVFIKDLEGIIQLAQQGILAASYYLARNVAQENQFQEALSVCARICLSPSIDDFSETIKNQARNFIEDAANQPISKGLTKYFTKQEELINYAKDLLETIKKNTPSANPDSVIEAFLHEKTEGPESSYNKYILAISSVGLKPEVAKPLRAADRRKNISE